MLNLPLSSMAQPFITLFQSNLQLLMQVRPPGAESQACTAAAPSNTAWGWAAPATPLASKDAVDLSRKLVKNYTVFLTEVGKSATQALTQGRTAMESSPWFSTRQAALTA